MAHSGNGLRLRVVASFIVVFFVILTLRHLWVSSAHQPMITVSEPPEIASPQIRKNIIVASRFPVHFDVYMAAVWTLGRVMNEGTLRVYANGPFRFDFQTVVDAYGLYNGTVQYQRDLLKEVREDEDIDLIILGTCEIDLRPEWSDPLLQLWDLRDDAHKFKLVCIVHNMQDTVWQENIPHWSRRNSIRIMPISAHVGLAFREKFLALSRDNNETIRSASYEYIPIDAHVPILDVPRLPDLPSRRLSNAVIQGSFDKNRRDYTNIFAELTQSLSVEPQLWGYSPKDNDGTTLVEDPSLGHPPFKLHLVGSGSLDVPEALQEVVVLHTDLNYPDFYRLMASMDVCIPAFVNSESQNNYKYQASSTIAMCNEVNLPILAVRALREAYTYIDDDAVTVTRPAVMSEIQAIKALRSGDASEFLSSDLSGSGVRIGSHPQVKKDVERMVREGWMRPKAGFIERKRRTWEQNERVVRKIIQWV